MPKMTLDTEEIKLSRATECYLYHFAFRFYQICFTNRCLLYYIILIAIIFRTQLRSKGSSLVEGRGEGRVAN